MSFVWWVGLWRGFEVYHRWSGRAFGDYTLKLLILPPKFCPLHQTCINQRFTTAYVLVAHSGRQKDKFVGKYLSLLCCWSLPSFADFNSFCTNICSTTIWSSCKLSQLFVLTFGNSSPSLCQQIHPWIISKLSLCAFGNWVLLLFLVTQILWRLRKNTEVSMQHHVCHLEQVCLFCYPSYHFRIKPGTSLYGYRMSSQCHLSLIYIYFALYSTHCDCLIPKCCSVSSVQK